MGIGVDKQHIGRPYLHLACRSSYLGYYLAGAAGQDKIKPPVYPKPDNMKGGLETCLKKLKLTKT
jgi:hypothetical protein